MPKKDKQETRGRTRLFEDDPLEANHLTKSQNERLRELAKQRGVPSTHVMREAVDWYLTALEKQRGEINVKKEDNEDFEKLVENQS